MNKKLRIKKSILALLAGVSMLGIGVGASSILNDSVSVHAETIAGNSQYSPTIHIKVMVGNKMRDLIPSYAGNGVGKKNMKGILWAPNISGYTPNIKGSINFTYNGTTKLTKLSKKLYYTKTATPVTYKNQKLSKQVKLAPGHDFYNHVPGSKYTAKRTHYGKTYKGKTITINMSGVKKGTKTPYYRCSYKGKNIGWIYGGALANVTSYKTVKKTATVIAKPTNNFYNHVTLSTYATKLTHFGKTYKNKKVTYVSSFPRCLIINQIFIHNN
ncbi:Bifunctional autolysin Atl [Pediococcus damnosus]|uniref:GW dipeptide domain-containing protein n=2 Tax=Pediococcus damnosus TaxID=51663 RepID=UPI00078E3203|nr:GW dipeptide domain-containing protein [Pediococcus damnosus]AMV60151.1 Bifunctional autolysin Atl [Pediococcus damnosus]AMV64396.1 Bifunctional autolysin Atl [Pediococcus damnosus]